MYSLSKYNKHFHNTKILLPHTQRLRVDIFFLLRSFLTMKMLKNCTLHSNEELLLIAKTTHMFPLQTNGNGVFYDITSYTFSKILMLIREFFYSLFYLWIQVTIIARTYNFLISYTTILIEYLQYYNSFNFSCMQYYKIFYSFEPLLKNRNYYKRGIQIV